MRAWMRSHSSTAPGKSCTRRSRSPTSPADRAPGPVAARCTRCGSRTPCVTCCAPSRGFAAEAPDPVGELDSLETEALLADLEVIEARIERVRKEGKKTPELALLERVREALEAEVPPASPRAGRARAQGALRLRTAHAQVPSRGAQRRGGRDRRTGSALPPRRGGRARHRRHHPLRAGREGHRPDGGRRAAGVRRVARPRRAGQPARPASSAPPSRSPTSFP